MPVKYVNCNQTIIRNIWSRWNQTLHFEIRVNSIPTKGLHFRALNPDQKAVLLVFRTRTRKELIVGCQ